MKFLKTNIPKDDLMLINIIYHRPRRDTEWHDFLDIVYKQISTGEKFVETIKDPKIEIYSVKPEYQDFDYNKAFMDITKCDKHLVEYRNLIKEIGKIGGPEIQRYIKECFSSGNRSAAQNVHKYKYVFGSDLDIESLYRIYWMQEYDNNKPKKISKLYADIETDIIDIVGFPKDGNCPIDAWTLIDDETKHSYTFLLRTPDNPLIPEFERDINEFVKDLHDSFDESYGHLDYTIHMYDDELEMIEDVYRLINQLKRDFILYWNGYGFDYPFIRSRIINLGGDPNKILTHRDFTLRESFMYRDTRAYTITAKKDDMFTSSYTYHGDDMSVYAKLRKAGSELRSTALNTVGRNELKDSKVDYAEESNLKMLSRTNYKKYVKYNIKDVLLQMGIEHKVSDVDNIYTRSYANVTSYKNNFAQTKFLASRAYYEYLLQGLIIGNNTNVTYGTDPNQKKEDTGVGFAGALVGNPENNFYAGTILLGKSSMYVFRYVVDFDYSSLYPSIIITFNIAPNCLIGKLLINESVGDLVKNINKAIAKQEAAKAERKKNGDTEEEDDDDDEALEIEDKGKDFMDDLLCSNPAIVGKKWFNLPGTEDIINQLKEDGLIGEDE